MEEFGGGFTFEYIFRREKHKKGIGDCSAASELDTLSTRAGSALKAAGTGTFNACNLQLPIIDCKQPSIAEDYKMCCFFTT